MRIRAGIELDNDPIHSSAGRKWIEKNWDKLDFVLGSVHFLECADQMFDSVPDGAAQFERRNIDEMYADYFRRLRELIATGLVDSLAHLDLIKIHGHRPTADIGTLINETLEFIRSRNLAIELSTAGWRKPVNELYPSDSIIESAMDKAIPFTTASDAHSHVQLGENFGRLADKMAELGIRQVCTFENQTHPGAVTTVDRAAILVREKRLFRFRRKRQIEAEPFGETLTRLQCEPFKVIAGKCPDTPHVCKMPLNFQRPAFQRGFALPE